MLVVSREVFKFKLLCVMLGLKMCDSFVELRLVTLVCNSDLRRAQYLCGNDAAESPRTARCDREWCCCLGSSNWRAPLTLERF